MLRPQVVRVGGFVAAFVLATTLASAVPAAAQTESQGTSIDMHLSAARVETGTPVRVHGRVNRSYAGRKAVLQFRAAGTAEWEHAAEATIDRRGRYRIVRALARSGALRIVLPAPPGTATASSAPASAERALLITPRVALGVKRLHVKAGRVAVVTGRSMPAVGGVRVALQVRLRGAWRTIDRARTRGDGAYRLRDRANRTLSAPARVVVAAHNGLATAYEAAGRLNVYRFAGASWYGPGFYGQRTGCGGRLGYSQLGVAHKTLPCGTKVTLRHRGRSVTVPVIDRGPYVAGREFDLTASTARRIGFTGHGAILVTR